MTMTPLETDELGSARTGSPEGALRWMVCGLLFFATTINYIDRSILSLLKQTLDDQLHWTSTQYGLVNSVFQFSYGLSFLGFGWFIDRFGTKIGYAVSITLWSIAAAGHALVGSVNGFMAARVFLGLGEAGNFPAAIKTVAVWFPKKERAFATSIFNSGANVANIIAPATVPFIAVKFGWHAAFIAAGIAGIIWLGIWLLLYHAPREHPYISPEELKYIESDRDEPLQERSVSWLSLLAYPQCWSFVTAKFLTDPVWWFFLIWLPDVFKKTRGLDIKVSAKYIVTIYAMVTVLSIFGGWITGWLSTQGWTVTRARKTGMFVFALCAVPIIFATQVTSVWGAVLLIGLAASAHQAWSANLYTTVSDMFPKKDVASVTGIGGTAGAVGGAIFPAVVGIVVDHYKAHGYAIIFCVCGFAYLLAFIIHHLLAPQFVQVPIKAVQAHGFEAGEVRKPE